MGKLKYLCILLLLTLTSCSSYSSLVCVVTYDSNYKMILYDGTYLYDYVLDSHSLSNKRLPITESTEQAKYLIGDAINYTITYNLPGSYSGDYSSAVGYINYLRSVGYKEEKHEATAEYYDITLQSVDGRVRVIMLNNDQIKIFYQNSEKLASSPPYINGKRGNN